MSNWFAYPTIGSWSTTMPALANSTVAVAQLLYPADAAAVTAAFHARGIL
jgi:hypothetical protein